MAIDLDLLREAGKIVLSGGGQTELAAPVIDVREFAAASDRNGDGDLLRTIGGPETHAEGRLFSVLLDPAVRQLPFGQIRIGELQRLDDQIELRLELRDDVNGARHAGRTTPAGRQESSPREVVPFPLQAARAACRRRVRAVSR